MAFPSFDDGDVLIRFNATDEPWILHSYILSLHSSWFKASLSERWSSDQNANDAPQGRRRLYELRFDKDSDEGTLMREWSPDSILMSDGSAKAEVQDEIYLSMDRRLTLRAHQMMLKTMYHVEPELNLEWCSYTRDLLQVLGDTADYYSCSQIIDPQSDYLLRRHWARVLRQCETAPDLMLEFGIAMRSDWVTTECCTHLIATPNEKYETMRHKLEELKMADLIDTKRSSVKMTRAITDRKLFCMTFEGELNYNALLALSVWRDWLAEEMNKTADRGNLAHLYRQIATGNSRCIDLSDTRRTHLATRGGHDMKNLRTNLDELFGSGKQYVEAILVDQRKLQKASTHDYLTFETIADSDLPWKEPRESSPMETDP